MTGTRVILAPIRPKRHINVAGYKKMVKEALISEGNKQLDLFEKTASTFQKKDQPHFKKTKMKSIGMDAEVQTGALVFNRANGIYSALNFGFERTIISNAPKKPMVFRSEYQRATHPGRVFSPTVATKTGDWVQSRVVHQKVSPRRFDIAVAQRRRGYFIRLIKGRFRKTPFWR